LTDPSPEKTKWAISRFGLIAAVVAAVAAALPATFNMLSAPGGTTYIGSVFNTDDHMVYAAWMRQAMSGHFFFDNRFTTDPQPGLTVHLYFWVLGLIASVTGIAIATNLARIALSFAFVLLLTKLVRRQAWTPEAIKLGIVLPVVAGGIGFLLWHTFGQVIVRPAPSLLTGPLMGLLPIDVWQPEAFVYASMLSNGLFMAALCLMAIVFISVLKARESTKFVWVGSAAMFLLMNIHSYDVLLVTFVLLGFAAASAMQKLMTREWVTRAILIGLGAIPAALWFVYVLKSDTVFQARAATPTFSPNFRQVILGILFPVVLALFALGSRHCIDPKISKNRKIGLGLLIGIILVLFALAQGRTVPAYFLGPAAWAVLFLASLIVCALLCDENPATNLIICWAVMGLVALYFPAPFQRKLAMGIVIPWAILAAQGLAILLQKQDRNAKKLLATLALVLFGASSVRWAFREVRLASANVSNTSMHPVYLSTNVNRILEYLTRLKGRHVLVALPGIASPVFRANEQETAPVSQLPPIVPDLNPIAAGFAGVYAYAGHWSETPDYLKRRSLATSLFLPDLPEARRRQDLKMIGADFVLTPTQESMPGLQIFDFAKLGEVVVDGPQFRLIKLKEE
jgi:hypothetical protein